ncbi:MAG TPA: hypothetical protein EYG95_03040 [Campylobacterales bacterium]|nr:hypothetical protein [Campylobacterales bacterium]
MKNLLLLFVSLFLLSACSSKSKYEPTEIESTLKYDANMKSQLSTVSRDGAAYENGMLVTKRRGLLKYKLEKDFRFIYDNENSILVSREDGTVRVLSNGETRFENKFEFALSAGAIKNNLLALIFSNNTLVLYDMKAKKELYSEALEPTFANDSRLANPVFLNDLVIFPTLDGRLLIMDSVKKVILRDVAISDKELFNNVIFLDEMNNVLVAATATKVIAINPKNINTKRIDVKDILYDTNALYIFTKTGRILLTDLNLNVKKEIKFPFAMFSAVTGTDKLYVVEKSGYLIEVDKNLESSKVYELPSEINRPLFTFKNRLFFGQHFLKIK